MKILIADGSSTMRYFLNDVLGEMGFHHNAQAEDGVHALEILLQRDGEPFDLAIVAWDMPRMNGLEFVQAVRGLPEFSGIKIMMITTQKSLARVTAATEAGVTDLLMQPVTRQSLEEKFLAIGAHA